MDIYSSKILELSTNIKNIGKKTDNNSEYFAQASKYSKLCGSEIELGLVLNQSKTDIIDFTINPKACALGQASAAILSQNIIGAKVEEVIKAYGQLKAMLKENGPLPDGRFWDLRYLEAVIDYKPRHASVLLAWEAAVDAINQVKNLK